ncbi:hypothetical protein ACE1TI_02145 [Alteribacillus sp. JSM 102045]|uniref:hypothetical protein n=1 Tax=Alteribacillus sp. JSM 102045 TaxID=1562101 RepID=UPI0035C0DEA4
MVRPEMILPAAVTKTQRNSGNMLQLKPGQVFEGKVLKLFPNQTAALRLGTMNVTAR